MPEANDQPNAGAVRNAGKIELGLALAITLAAVFLHLTFFQHAGGLWRDEASTVRLATLPEWRDFWRYLPYDHCPALPLTAMRAWSAMGWGKTDADLRGMGLVVGLALTAAFWMMSWATRRAAPLIPLTLVCLNAEVIRTVDSFRGYGLGCVMTVLMLACLWRAARKGASVATILPATLAAVLCVQCLYQNAFFVLAACCAGFVVCSVEKRWRDAFWVLAIGATAAVSLLPYVPIIQRSQEWYLLEKAGFTFALGLENASQAAGYPMTSFRFLWLALGLMACVTVLSVLWSGFREKKVPGLESARLVLFGGTALVVGLAGFAFFLKHADLPTQPWYYVPLLVFGAACFDMVLPTYYRWLRPVLVVLAGLTVLLALTLGLPALQKRQTNVDVIAAKLSEQAQPDDLVLVHPWVYGISFDRYYDGPAPWTTMPPLADHRFHRYDLFKLQMQLENPIQPVMDRVAATLQSGHRVWIIGKISLDDNPPAEIRPAPNNPWGWLDRPYSIFWGEKMGNFIVTHITAGEVVVNPPTNSVNPFEHLPLVWVSGWKDAPATKQE